MVNVRAFGPMVGLSIFLATGLGDSLAPLLAQTTGSSASGNQIILNGKTYPGYWFRSNTGGREILGISDGDLDNDFGMLLLDSNDPQTQPIQWFSPSPVSLSTLFPASGAIRYLDIDQLKTQLGWQIQARGSALVVNSAPTQVRSLKSGIQTWGRRIVVELERPAPWRFTELTNSRSGKTDRNFTLTVDAALASTSAGIDSKPGGGLTSISVAPQGQQTLIKGQFSGGMRAEAWTLASPPRLVIDIRPTPMRSRNIAWAPGVRRRESTVSLGTQQFPLSWMEIDPKTTGLRLLPMWGNQPSQIVGIHTLADMSSRLQAAASINAGFFDRKFQNPLGAIRRDGQWVSTPILNRGVIAWNDSGQFQVGRMSLSERLQTSTGRSLTVGAQNSGYPQGGLSRYTPDWGRAYTPIKQDGTEQVFTVIKDRVVSQALSKGISQFPIPRDGYLLVARVFDAQPLLPNGTTLKSEGVGSTPSQFSQYPHIMGAGPLLVSNNQVVLNIASETFQNSFEAEAAPRSAIAQRTDGTILLVTSHNRVGGAGPTLPEWARILQQMGGVNALNLDGGSSTTLYLGGHLVDRHPVTAARVHSALGVFLNHPPSLPR